jgi:glyoxylase-like metal-dependent hydrolase (beta-lactamase superfamily II)
MSQITLHPHGIYQVRLPMANPPWMNSYLVPDGDGYALIDPGFNTEAVIELWQSVAKEIGLSFDRIRKILVTHHHPDHYGLAGWFQQQSGAPVYVSTLAKRQIEGLWGEGRPLVAHFLETYRQNGMPADLLAQLKEQLENNLHQVLPHATLTTLDEGETIRIGDTVFQVLHVPGHAAGHSAFYSEDWQVIFIGDEVMPDSLPDTCFVSDEFDPSPIRSYIESLDKLHPYQVQWAFPGHHQPFAHFRERLAQLHRLNAERQQKVVDQFAADTWKTVYEAYYGVFEPVSSLIQKRFHFTETISRVRYALSQGLIEQTEQNGILKYRKNVS